MTSPVSKALALAGLACALQAHAQATISYFSEFVSGGGKGPVLLVISGASGPDGYVTLARDFAAEGYHVVLLDANEFQNQEREGAVAMLRTAAERARKSPGAQAGKIGVVGFSLGGGRATLGAAATDPELVFATVAHYPATRFIADPAAFVAAVRVPTLLMAGGRDRYRNCCLAETARTLDTAAKAAPGPRFLELVEYADADHAWNLAASWNGDVAADSFKRTLAHLRANRVP